MKKERVKPEEGLLLKFRVSEKVAMRLLWLLMGGSAVAAGFSHWVS